MDQHAPILDAQQSRLSAPIKPPARRVNLRLVLMIAGAVALLIGLACYGVYYWKDGQFLVSTDDAYIDADSVIVSPKISGYISDVAVEDNQTVRAGQVLACIDDRDYETALQSAQAAVAAQQAAIDDLTQQIGEQQLAVTQAQATVTADQANVTYAAQDQQRYLTLSRSGAGTLQSAQESTSVIRQAEAALNRDNAAVDAARKQIDVLRAQLAEARAVLMQQEAAERQAELNLSYTNITATTDGTVGARSVRVGQYVQAGTELMAVVPLRQVYVTANFKETQLTDVQPGQKVAIRVDTFPDATVHGWVDSIAPASGEEFALLPPDNATGNFTKIVQRVPVKIRIDPNDALIGRLRPGMSVEPEIDTKPAAVKPGA
jgi:membrane fusion protein (multidrug efflux system)